MTNITADTEKTIGDLRAMREEFIDNFRKSGERDMEKAQRITLGLQSLINKSSGRNLAHGLYELATIQRINNEYEAALSTYERAASAIEGTGDTDVQFRIWLGIARSHAYGTRNHGAADLAFEQAIKFAGENATRKQRYEIADYSSQLLGGRGELESALLNALDSIELAEDDPEKFYAYLDTGDALQKFAESCDYRKIVDAKTNSEEDSWGACKRAVASAGIYYEKARATAAKLSWNFLEKESQGFIDRLRMRLFIIERKEAFEKMGVAGVFNAVDAKNVLVNDNFSAGGSELSSDLPLAPLIEQVVPEGQNDPRSIYLRGIKADLDKNPQKALEFYKQAADLLSVERISLFDIRQRGTVVENRPELFRDLALRLLSFGHKEEAFRVFESVRSSGLSSLAMAFEQQQFTPQELELIARQVQLDSLISARQNILVEATIAGIAQNRSLELLRELRDLKNQRQSHKGQAALRKVIGKLSSVKHSIPDMYQLQAAVKKKNIPVVLYWVTHTNVVVWIVSTDGIEVKTVFLPEVALLDKIRSLVKSLESPQRKFDQQGAKELYAYLIAPFKRHFSRKQIIIVPQGPLLGLPFEALVDAESGKYLMEDILVSYAPNASFVISMLEKSSPTSLDGVMAIYDESINTRTGEIEKIRQLPAVKLNAVATKDLSTGELLQRMGSAKNIHVLLHGNFDNDDPLQSSITVAEQAASRQKITAAELLAVNWRNTDLAVFGSCEGANLKTRISNEIFGIAWSLLAGGVDNLVLSRWRVMAASNAIWMEAFYKSLATGVRPAVAVNRAMQTMLGSNYQHPYYWAAPQVFGC